MVKKNYKELQNHLGITISKKSINNKIKHLNYYICIQKNNTHLNIKEIKKEECKILGKCLDHRAKGMCGVKEH